MRTIPRPGCPKKSFLRQARAVRPQLRPGDSGTGAARLSRWPSEIRSAPRCNCWRIGGSRSWLASSRPGKPARRVSTFREQRLTCACGCARDRWPLLFSVFLFSRLRPVFGSSSEPCCLGPTFVEIEIVGTGHCFGQKRRPAVFPSLNH